MLIQRNGSSTQRIILNFFYFGLDVLLDFETRTVTKFILHTNLPGHYDFGEYSRASFEIRCNSRQDPFEQCVLVTDSKLESFRDAFADENGICTPVVVNREPSNNVFGSTFCYGHKNDQLIVEVLDNSFIGSVIIYDSGDRETPVSAPAEELIEEEVEDGIF